MKMKKMIYLAFALLLLSANNMNAQVAIGTENPNMEPHTGAILDLGQVKNKDLGLLLPKVALTAHDVWAPVEGVKVDGMMVYNDSPCAINGLNGKGAYVWYDNSWHKIGAAASSTCGCLTDIDGNTYNTGYFGKAGCWMTENLKVTKYADGTAINYKNGVSNSDLFKKEYAYPNNDAANKATLGLLYTWAAASGRTDDLKNEGNNATQTQYQGACPDGWHLPSDYEWSELEEVIALDDVNKYSSDGQTAWQASYYTRISLEGGHGYKMRSQNLVGTQTEAGASWGSDNNGFDVLLVGVVAPAASAAKYGEWSRFYTSSKSPSGTTVWYRLFYFDQIGVLRNTLDPKYLDGVRCKKNTN